VVDTSRCVRRAQDGRVLRQRPGAFEQCCSNLSTIAANAAGAARRTHVESQQIDRALRIDVLPGDAVTSDDRGCRVTEPSERTDYGTGEHDELLPKQQDFCFSAARDRIRSRTRPNINLMRPNIWPRVARFYAPRQPVLIYDSDTTSTVTRFLPPGTRTQSRHRSIRT
jgi:hypothetical protein